MFYRASVHRRGFTLVEALVVGGILTVLASVVLFSASEARQQSRDNKRKVDLKQLQLAIELYAQENGEYPPTCVEAENPAGPNSFKASKGGGSGYGSSPADLCDEYILGLVPKYIDKLPHDPKRDVFNRGFQYFRSDDGKNYKLYVFGTVETLLPELVGGEFSPFGPGCAAPSNTANWTNTYAVSTNDFRCFQ